MSISLTPEFMSSVIIFDGWISTIGHFFGVAGGPIFSILSKTHFTGGWFDGEWFESLQGVCIWSFQHKSPPSLGTIAIPGHRFQWGSVVVGSGRAELIGAHEPQNINNWKYCTQKKHPNYEDPTIPCKSTQNATKVTSKSMFRRHRKFSEFWGGLRGPGVTAGPAVSIWSKMHFAGGWFDVGNTDGKSSKN